MKTRVLLLGLLACVPVFSQTFGEITGEVKDSAGAIIVGAKVTATNTGTSAERDTLTNGAGVYSFPSLQPGDYDVRVEQPGFRAAVSHIELQVQQAWARSVYWMYGLVVREDTGMDAAEFANRLKQRGVETRPFFLGMHEQPVLRERGLFHGERYPVAERIARQGLYLPSGLGLEEAHIDRVCEAVREALA